MPHPDGLPELFLDRSLGRMRVPSLLREAGLQLLTLSEHYGVPADEGIADETWLQLAGERGWAVFIRTRGSATTRRSVPLSGSTAFDASVCRARASRVTTWQRASSTTSMPSLLRARTMDRSSTSSTRIGSSAARWTSSRDERADLPSHELTGASRGALTGERSPVDRSTRSR